MEYLWIGQGGVRGVWVVGEIAAVENTVSSIVLDIVMDWGCSVARVRIRMPLELGTGHTKNHTWNNH